jgi:signal transduction histidine kinase
VGEMSATLAHEIKNPMTGISTFVQLFDSQHKDPDYIERFKKTMPAQVKRINETLQKLLHFAKSPQISIKKEDLVKIIQSQIEFLKRPEIQLTYKGPQKFLINTDSNVMQEIIVNLALNAVEAKANKISFEILHNHKEWRLHITDNGPGISKNIQKKMFQPFFSTKTYGTGLGLATVQKNVQALGGQLQLVSALGKGSTFILKFAYSVSSMP